MDALTVLVAGLGLGIATSIPIGPVAGVVVQLAVRHDRRAALLCGLGCALVDALYSFGAGTGVAALLEAYPGIVRAMYVGSGLVLSGFSIATFRDAARGGRSPASGTALVPPRRRAFFSGVVLSATNPVPLIAWIGLSGTVLAGVSRALVPFFSLGVLVGVVAWFTAVTELTHRGKGLVSGRLPTVSRIIGALLAVSAALCFWHALAG